MLAMTADAAEPLRKSRIFDALQQMPADLGSAK
jgi:hypothetical protein